MAWSCKKDDSAAPPPEDKAVAVRFSSNIGGLASLVRSSALKASGTAWAGNDAIGVFMVNHGSNDVRNEATNKRYVTATGNGNFAPAAADTIYYPVNGDKVDFIAYYPYVSSISTLGAYAVNVSDQSAPAAIDLLYAKADNSSAGYDESNTSSVALTFSHKLSKLTLNIAAPTASTLITAPDLASMTVSIAGLNTQASFNLAAGTLGAASAPAAITPYVVTAGAKYEAILLPGDFSGVSVTFGVTAGSSPGNYVWNIPNGAFEAGKEYVYSVSFTGASNDVSVTGVINPWELVTPEIPLAEPADGAYISANLATFPVRFSWTEAPGIANYKLRFSPLNDFVNPSNYQEIPVNGGYYDLISATCEGMLSSIGINPNATVDLYWTVVPATDAEVRTYSYRFTARRAGPAATLPTTGWTATANSTYDGSLAGLLDGDPLTYWAGSGASTDWNSWIKIDMQGVKKLSGMSLYERIGSTYNTKVFVSMSDEPAAEDASTNANKTKIAEWTMAQNPIEYPASFGETMARYIYIYTRGYGNDVASFYEATLTGVE
jgi:hypothetical protein